MMPSPEQGASHGTDDDPRTSDDVPPIAHLLHRCQVLRPVPVGLCGTTVARPVYVGRGLRNLPPRPCVVCLDLAAGSGSACERCPT